MNKLTSVVRVDPLLEELIPGFLTSVRNDVNAVRDALDRNDFGTIVRIGHNIKGAGGGYGFEVISDIGTTINRAAQDADATKIAHEIEHLSTYLSQVQIIYE